MKVKLFVERPKKGERLAFKVESGVRFDLERDADKYENDKYDILHPTSNTASCDVLLVCKRPGFGVKAIPVHSGLIAEFYKAQDGEQVWEDTGSAGHNTMRVIEVDDFSAAIVFVYIKSLYAEKIKLAQDNCVMLYAMSIYFFDDVLEEATFKYITARISSCSLCAWDIFTLLQMTTAFTEKIALTINRYGTLVLGYNLSNYSYSARVSFINKHLNYAKTAVALIDAKQFTRFIQTMISRKSPVEPDSVACLEMIWLKNNPKTSYESVLKLLKVNALAKLQIHFDARFELYTTALHILENHTEYNAVSSLKVFKLIFCTGRKKQEKSQVLQHALNSKIIKVKAAMTSDISVYDRRLKDLEQAVYSNPDLMNYAWQRYLEAILEKQFETSQILYDIGIRRTEKPTRMNLKPRKKEVITKRSSRKEKNGVEGKSSKTKPDNKNAGKIKKRLSKGSRSKPSRRPTDPRLRISKTSSQSICK